MARGAKPGERRGGRQKGTPNKLTADIKETIAAAFDEAGGKEYLVGIAKDDPRTFCTLLGKIIPTTVGGDPENPIQQIVNVITGVPRAPKE